MGRTKKCSAATRAGRLRKARSFRDAAELIRAVLTDADDLDAYAALCVLAGIAASDVLCCARLGEHASGDNHQEAAALLAKVDRSLAKDLTTLLGMKRRAEYEAAPVSKPDSKRARAAVDRLVQAALDVT